MQPKEIALACLGTILALLMGVPYFILQLSTVWFGNWMPWVLIIVFATSVVTGLLTFCFKPRSLWLFPAAFSAPTWAYALVGGFSEPVATLTWSAVGAATIGIGVAAGHGARAVKFATKYETSAKNT